MKKFASVLVSVVLSATAFGVFAGRTGDQWMLQERQNQRVVAEKQKQAEIQAMAENCLKMHKSN